MDTRELLTKYYEYVNAGDWESWLTLFPEDFVFEEQVAGRVEGVAIMRAVVDGFKKGYAKFQNVPREFIIEGDKGCVVSHISAANMSGVPIEANVCNFFRVANGKIVYVANFHDTRPFDAYTNQQLD